MKQVTDFVTSKDAGLKASRFWVTDAKLLAKLGLTEPQAITQFNYKLPETMAEMETFLGKTSPLAYCQRQVKVDAKNEARATMVHGTASKTGKKQVDLAGLPQLD